MTNQNHDPAQLAADEDALQGADVETTTSDSDGTKKPGGLGDDGTIPNSEDGLAAGHSDTDSNFNPEEDEQAG
ncbi:hypothetical protein [Arenivirga flava]|uniref:Uncharacterized protein n=1 Tax=Arenivirga flava TaxID=1930060 RepID=A0AA37XCR0_9MICO|nr:hypothetical protein [Arenivirga flava]GMA28667.1 hypothetical protein GCM10025874_19200 [Arenivirga flava]